MYEDWGFIQNPFDTKALPANYMGEKLLIGREKSLKKLKSRIASIPKATTIEGPNGVGKTSLANVASFVLHKESMQSKGKSRYFPCRKDFQLTADIDPKSFKSMILKEVIQTIIDFKNDLPVRPGHVKPEYNSGLDRWLNRVEQISGQFGVQGFQIGGARTVASTPGFDYSGFEKAAIDWLEKLFPEPNSGGVICVVDNLELLRTSASAARALEVMRDEIMNIAGIRWVFCGARGIIYGAAQSPRLDGYFHAPLTVHETLSVRRPSVYSSRVEAFKANDNYRLPVTELNFNELSQLFRGNLRSILSSLDDYCRVIHDEGWDSFEEIPYYSFDDWLDEKSIATFQAIDRTTTDDEKQILAWAIEKNRAMSETEHRRFGQKTPKKFAECLRALEECGVMTAHIDEADSSRILYKVSAKGYLVARCRNFKRFSKISSPISIKDGTSDEEWFEDSAWSGDTSSED